MALVDYLSRTSGLIAGGTRRLSLRSRLNLWRSRRSLARLSSEALDDVGISAEEAEREAKRPIWDVPGSWKCD